MIYDRINISNKFSTQSFMHLPCCDFQISSLNSISIAIAIIRRSCATILLIIEEPIENNEIVHLWNGLL